MRRKRNFYTHIIIQKKDILKKKTFPLFRRDFLSFFLSFSIFNGKTWDIFCPSTGFLPLFWFIESRQVRTTLSSTTTGLKKKAWKNRVIGCFDTFLSYLFLNRSRRRWIGLDVALTVSPSSTPGRIIRRSGRTRRGSRSTFAIPPQIVLIAKRPRSFATSFAVVVLSAAGPVHVVAFVVVAPLFSHRGGFSGKHNNAMCV